MASTGHHLRKFIGIFQLDDFSVSLLGGFRGQLILVAFFFRDWEVRG